MAHQLFGVDAVAARDQHDAGRVGVVGLVADVLQPRQLLGAHLRGDLLDHLAGRGLVGQRGDDQVAAVLHVHGAGADAAQAGLVHLQQVGGRGDDLRRGRVVGAAHVLAQVARGRVRVVEQAQAGADDLVEVVRRHVGGHAHGNAGGAVEQQVRQPRRHPGRLFQRAVEVRRPVDRALAEFAQQHFGDRGQLGLGVAHRRERLRVVGGTEVALALDQRIAVRERLRHQHHRLVAGAVAVRVVLADDVADGARGLLRLGAGVEAEFAHRIDDAALHRLEAVAEEGQGAVEDHVHRVIEVGALGVLAQGDLLEAVEGRTDGVGHGGGGTNLE